MKSTLFLIFTLLSYSIGLNAQHFSTQSIENNLHFFNQVKEKAVEIIKDNDLKDNRISKASTPYESYYTLEYNVTNQTWDTISRATFYVETIGSYYHLSALGEYFTPQGYIKGDSISAYTDSTLKYYKVHGNDIQADSGYSFIFDSTSNSWFLLGEVRNFPNANGDLEFSISNFGPLGTDSARYFYDSANNLTHFLSWSNNIFVPNSSLIDSVVCQPNSAGYRTLDTLYRLDSNQQWQFYSRSLYEYDNNNKLTQRIEDDFIKISYIYDANNELIADSLYYKVGSGSNASFELQSYTLYNQDSTTSFNINGGVPEIQWIDRFYYSNNKLDSVVALQRFGFGSTSQLQFTYKDIYININTSIKDNDLSDLTFQAYPNPAKDELYIEAPNEILEVFIYDLSGVERFRSIERANFKINVSFLESGVYFLKVKDSIKKIIIQ